MSIGRGVYDRGVEHRIKAGMEYWFTPQIKGGFDMVVASDQIFFNDWANTNAPLAGYATVNLHGSYDVTKNVQTYKVTLRSRCELKGPPRSASGYFPNLVAPQLKP